MNEEKKCSKCGMILPEGSSVCSFCGTPYDGSNSHNNVYNATVDNQQGSYDYGTQQQIEYGTTQQSNNGYSNQTQQNTYATDNSGYSANAGYSSTNINYKEKKESNAMAIWSLVLSIISLITCCIPFVGIICGLIALVLAGIALIKKKPGKGMSIASIIITIVAFLACAGCWLFVLLSGTSLYDKVLDMLPVEGMESLVSGSTEENLFDYNNDNSYESIELSTVKIASVEYILPVSMSSVFEEPAADEIQKIASNGISAGKYTSSYFSYGDDAEIYYGWMDNLGSETEYDYLNLYLTTIVGDYYINGAGDKVLSDMEVYGGIKIGSTDSDIRSAFCDYNIKDSSDDDGNPTIEVSAEDMFFVFTLSNSGEVIRIYASCD